MPIPPVYSSYCYGDARLVHCPQNSPQAESGEHAPARDTETQDTVSFSDEAIKKSQGTGEDAEAQNKDFSAPSGEENQGNINTLYSAGKTGSSGRGGEADAAATAQETINSIRKQIKEVKKQLEKAESRMTEGTGKTGTGQGQHRSRTVRKQSGFWGATNPAEPGCCRTGFPAMNVSAMEGASEAMSGV